MECRCSSIAVYCVKKPYPHDSETPAPPSPHLHTHPQEAEAALNSLDKASLGELKSFGSPAAEIVQVLGAVMVLSAPGGNIPKDLSWAAGKKAMVRAGGLEVLWWGREVVGSKQDMHCWPHL